jgi:ADP-ribose pyrophosphatase YjhB (NUDIX family)
VIENIIQRRTLSKCSFFATGARYSQLKPQNIEIENDLFNYHLQKLVKNGYLKKENRLYELTPKGKSTVTNIDHETISIPTKYKVSVYLCPIINNKVLLYKRKRHPQYGYVGLASGKKNFGEKITDAAKRELKEETGLDANFKIIGNMHQIRKDEQCNVIEDGVFYICYTDKVTGELDKENKEGEFFWIDINEATNIKNVFKPSLEIILKEVKLRLTGKKSWEEMFIYEFEPEPENY